jgi:hypothetical protein
MTSPTIDKLVAHVETELGKYDRHRRTTYNEDAVALIARLPEDPYVLAVFMEDSFGHEASQELAKLLGDIWPTWVAFHGSVVSEWVASQNMKLFPVGSTIAYTSRGVPSEGKIIKVDAAAAQYHVPGDDCTLIVDHEDATLKQS